MFISESGLPELTTKVNNLLAHINNWGVTNFSIMSIPQRKGVLFRPKDKQKRTKLNLTDSHADYLLRAGSTHSWGHISRRHVLELAIRCNFCEILTYSWYGFSLRASLAPEDKTAFKLFSLFFLIIKLLLLGILYNSS